MSTEFPETRGSEASAPREFTPEELDAARAQLLAQGEDLGGQAPADPQGLALGAVAAGAEAQSVDAGELLAQIRQMQARVDALEAEKRAANVPDVVKYAQALRDHLAVKAAAHPVIQADPDNNWGQVLSDAGQLAEDAQGAADSGKAGKLGEDVAHIEDWVKAHARKFPHIDYSYVLDLAAEAGKAVAVLAA